MINVHLCFGKLGRCCKHLPHGGRWAAHQQGKDQDLEKSKYFLVHINFFYDKNQRIIPTTKRIPKDQGQSSREI